MKKNSIISNYWDLIDYNVHHIRHSELKASLILTAYGIIFGMAYDVSGELIIPEMKEYEGTFGKPHKSSVIFTYKHTFAPIQEIFGKGFIFDGINCHFDEDGRKSVTVKFEKETRV